MTANTKLIHAIADALIGEYDEEATEWLEDGGRANFERIVAEWRAAIEQGRWVERLEDVLVLRALRHVRRSLARDVHRRLPAPRRHPTPPPPASWRSTSPPEPTMQGWAETGSTKPVRPETVRTTRPVAWRSRTRHA